MQSLRIVVCSLLVVLAGLASSSVESADAWTVGFLAGSGGLGDESFNDMTYKGLGMAMKEYDIDVVVREWEANRSMDILLKELLAENPQLVILNGDQFKPLIAKFVSLHPQVMFIANDFVGGKYPNLKSVVYSQHEGSFLAGALAGSFSKTGRVAFLGGVDIPVVDAFKTGFAEGIRLVSTTVEIEARYISSLPDYTGFNNPKRAFDIARELYRTGVDVIFAVAGSSGNGIIQAAKVTGKYVIGVDSNQDHMAKGHVLTSVMKRLDTAIYQETQNVYLGHMKPGTVWYGLANGGISLTPMKFTRDIIPEKIVDKLASLKKKIINGDISVTNSLYQDNSPHTVSE